VEGYAPPRSNPRKFTATFDGSFEDNDCTGTGRAGVFAGFLNNGVVTRNPGYIKANKYLQDSEFTLQIDDETLSPGFDYDNPVIDPFDQQTPLNNQLTMNGDELTGKHVTCPPRLPVRPADNVLQIANAFTDNWKDSAFLDVLPEDPVE